MTQNSSRLKGLLALTPLIVFMVSYLAVSLITGDFYKMPISVAFLIASVYAIAITRNKPFNRRISTSRRARQTKM